MNTLDHEDSASHFIPSTEKPKLNLHLWARDCATDAAPALFVHGATFGSRLYDIPLPGASWLAATAAAGVSAYALDIRGYGRSSPHALDSAQQPFATAEQAICDIDDAVAWISARHDGSSVRLVGGSWGSLTTALYTVRRRSNLVCQLVLYAPIFAEHNAGWLARLRDPNDETKLNTGLGVWRLAEESALRARWDAEMPDGANWRDEAVFQSMLQAAVQDDPTASERKGASFRVPNGVFQDIWEVFNERPLYDPAAIKCPVMLIRGSADPTSTRTGSLALFEQLGSKDKQYVEIAGGTHYLTAERRASQVFEAVNTFFRTLAG